MAVKHTPSQMEFALQCLSECVEEHRRTSFHRRNKSKMGTVTIRNDYLDALGYNSSGRYFGRVAGAPVFLVVVSTPDEVDSFYFRGPRHYNVRKALRELYPQMHVLEKAK